MKKILLIFCAIFAYADFKTYFDKLNEANTSILGLYNPFFINDMNAKLHLQAIFNDKAKINEEWYQKDDTVDGARIIEISQKQGFILLEKNSHHFYLTLKRINHKIHIR